MERTTMHIDGRSHSLDPSQDLEKVKGDVVEAVRAGGDLVQVTVAGGHVLDVLVAPGVSVAFETETNFSEGPDDEFVASIDAIDFDDYLLFL
ncbi:hypothetical protein IFT72_15610 [Frigoribacterium sp. CFBP 8754]|uniref:hypothetical protein n=1 Tax=unclassified Frigoribacterium TaxID=2627005 RepID=UPI001780E7F8|nr:MULTISPECIES: hypothetical protein [unclassified Frigoribacterium]MBD8661613.1 hypothetical protein [Frigoribacterium sp. CFBP 8754]MBD8729535.1 hypothetical protein [Frigoribacterium sp. CFBP 13707]